MAKQTALISGVVTGGSGPILLAFQRLLAKQPQFGLLSGKVESRVLQLDGKPIHFKQFLGSRNHVALSGSVSYFGCPTPPAVAALRPAAFVTAVTSRRVVFSKSRVFALKSSAVHA